MTNPSSWFRRGARIASALMAATLAGALLVPVLGAPQSAAAATATPIEQYGPTSDPDRIVLTPSGDLSNRQAVTWRTSTGVTRPRRKHSCEWRRPSPIAPMLPRSMATRRQRAG